MVVITVQIYIVDFRCIFYINIRFYKVSNQTEKKTIRIHTEKKIYIPYLNA